MDGNVIPLRPREERPEPPANVEAEQALLGALLFRNEIYGRVAEILEPEHFSEPLHGQIFAAISKLIDEGRRADPVSLKAMFDKVYLAKLAESVITLVNVPDYAKTIRDCHDRRQLMFAGEDLVLDAASFDLDRPASQIADEHEQRIYEIAERKPQGAKMAPLSAYLETALQRVEKAITQRGKVVGVPSGLADVDNLLGGFMPGELTILAGRPNMGKSTVAKSIGMNAARAGFVIPYFSTEMPGATLAMWCVADLTGISADRMRRGDLDSHDVNRWRDAQKSLAPLGLHIDDTAGNTLAKLRDRARRMKRRQGLGMIIIDHLGHLTASKDARKQGRTQEVSEISGGLLSIAKELDVPVLALCQLNRAVESRDDKRPTLADLRDSGSLEQDADTVIFVYRPEYYLSRSEPEQKIGESRDKFAAKQADWHAEMDRVRGVCELIVAKRRSGPIDTVRVKWEPERSRVTNLAGNWQ